MLTWSDWRTEPRSNRYHYATRLAMRWPVLFVQPDAAGYRVTVEESGSNGIRLVHVARRYNRYQSAALALTLNDLGYRRPLLWIYNPRFNDFIETCRSPLRIYHATEDFFVEGGVTDAALVPQLRAMLGRIDLLIAVSESVRRNCLDRGGYSGESLMLSNGCDYAFWSASTGSAAHDDNARARKVAIYQGGVNLRLDFALLEQVIARLPDWEFWFCGRLDPTAAGRWKRLRRLPNLRYLGELAPADLRNAMNEAQVGIIPFVDSEMITVSMPLKAFEYVACGLPVVSTPILALEKHPGLFRLARSPADFALAMKEALDTRFDEDATAARRNIAKQYDYDARFAEFEAWVEQYQRGRKEFVASADMPLAASDGSALREILIPFRERVAALADWLWHEMPPVLQKMLRPLMNRIRSKAS